jgi:choline dehydrogenase
MNITTPKDPGDGNKEGVFWAPSSLEPSDQTRSYARRSHYDRVKSRSNYHILPENAVSKIIFKGKTAVGAEYISTQSKRTGLVTARKEIILAAGSMHTPQILQLSGIGPKKLLDSLGIDVLVDSPGVGQNFQDNPTIYANFTCKADRTMTSSLQLLIRPNHSFKSTETTCRNAYSRCALQS